MKTTVSVILCDQCGQVTPDAKRYTVKHASRTVDVELCEADSQPLRNLLTSGTRRRTRTRTDNLVTTVEQIEQRKRVTLEP